MFETNQEERKQIPFCEEMEEAEKGEEDLMGTGKDLHLHPFLYADFTIPRAQEQGATPSCFEDFFIKKSCIRNGSIFFEGFLF